MLHLSEKGQIKAKPLAQKQLYDGFLDLCCLLYVALYVYSKRTKGFVLKVVLTSR